MSKSITIIIISILLLCNVILLFANRKQKCEAEASFRTLYPYAQKYTILIESLKENIHYSNYIIDDVKIEDKNSKEIQLSDLLGNNDIIFIVRLSDRFCNTCEQYTIDLFTKHINYEDVKITYLTDSFNSKKLRTLENRLTHKINGVYNVPILETSLDKAGFPYLMVLNRNLEIEYCYFPKKGNSEADIENINMIIDGFAKKTKNK